MKTTIAAGGKPQTQMHSNDRKALEKARGLALHCAANVPGMKETGESVAGGIFKIVGGFDANGNEKPQFARIPQDETKKP